MEAAAAAAISALSSPSSSSSPHKLLSSIYSPATFSHFSFPKYTPRLLLLSCRSSISSSSSSTGSTTPSSANITDAVAQNSTPDSVSETVSSNSSRKDSSLLPKIDKSGRFCSPRAARELALSILYASCLDGSDPVRLFEKRVNAGRESGYVFDKAALMEYNHMSFGGPPVTTQTVEEADEILQKDQKESDIEAEVLSAPPKLVYSKLILRFTRKLLVAVVQNWDNNVLAIDKVVPQNWKNEPAGRILELSVLHLAMSEIAVLETRHQIAINEAVDLAKRFCDGAAPRIINGCLRTFVKELNRNGEDQNLKIKQAVGVVGY